MSWADWLYDEGIGNRHSGFYPHKNDNKDGKPDAGRVGGLGKYILSAMVENGVRATPEWVGHGVIEEAYTALRGGIIEAANQYKHSHGLDVGKFNILGFQNLYPVVMKFGEGLLDIDEFYTYRDPTGRETPIAFAGQNMPQPGLGRLIHIGENTPGNEKTIGGTTVRTMLDVEHRNGDFLKANGMGEITSMDSKKVMDPTVFTDIYARHQVWLAGHEGERSVLSPTPNGGQIVRYRMPTAIENFKTLLRLDLRYSVRNMPLNALSLEDLPRFRGEPLQRMLGNIARGTVISEQTDYSTYGFGPTGIPFRSDGYLNPVAQYL
ncbi:MAG: hypothetical protein JSV63_04115 [Candidatus Aenigmatarchaeota archaeon]|nr:MAG: hypothetical protein JSV63_04115 [Candidatus Aenigmarchaeota archaeon]